MAAPISAIEALLTTCSQHQGDAGVLKITNTSTKETGYFHLDRGFVFAAELDSFTPPYRKRLRTLPGTSEFIDVESVFSLAGGEQGVTLPFLLVQRQVADEQIIKAIAIDYLLDTASKILTWESVKVKWQGYKLAPTPLVVIDGGQIVDRIARNEEKISAALGLFETDRNSINDAVIYAQEDPNAYLTSVINESRAFYSLLLQEPKTFKQLRDEFGLTEYSAIRALHNLWSYELATINTNGHTNAPSQEDIVHATREAELRSVEETLLGNIAIEEKPEPLPHQSSESFLIDEPLNPKESTRPFTALPERPVLSRFLSPLRNKSQEVSNLPIIEDTIPTSTPQAVEESAPNTVLPTISESTDLNNSENKVSESTPVDYESTEDSDPLAGFSELYDSTPSNASQEEEAVLALLENGEDPLTVEKTEDNEEISSPSLSVTTETPELNDDNKVQSTPSLNSPAGQNALLTQLHQLINQANTRRNEINDEVSRLTRDSNELDVIIKDIDESLQVDPNDSPDVHEDKAAINAIYQKLEELQSEVTKLQEDVESRQEVLEQKITNARTALQEKTSEKEKAVADKERLTTLIAELSAEKAELDALPSL